MIELLITLIIIGAALYLLQLVPMDATVKQIVYVIAIVAVLIWVLEHFTGLVHV